MLINIKSKMTKKMETLIFIIAHQLVEEAGKENFDLIPIVKKVALQHGYNLEVKDGKVQGLWKRNRLGKN